MILHLIFVHDQKSRNKLARVDKQFPAASHTRLHVCVCVCVSYERTRAKGENRRLWKRCVLLSTNESSISRAISHIYLAYKVHRARAT